MNVDQTVAPPPDMPTGMPGGGHAPGIPGGMPPGMGMPGAMPP